jgi:hypothetical protein
MEAIARIPRKLPDFKSWGCQSPQLYLLKKGGVRIISMKPRLPHIEEIVRQRIDAGIASWAESECYAQLYLDDSDWSDERKRELLAELKQAKRKKRKVKSADPLDWLTPKQRAGE